MEIDIKANEKIAPLPLEPYKGIKSFSYADRAIFAAREWEKEQLLYLITISRGNLLYGQTGTGKSSLVNAGLVPMLKEKFFNVEIIRFSPTQGGTFVIYPIEGDLPNTYLPSLFDQFSTFDINSDKVEVKSISVAFENFEKIVKSHVSFPKETDTKVSGTVLIFDQFEELITLFEESSQTAEKENKLNIKELKDLQTKIILYLQDAFYNQDLNIKLLFVFREDYLAKFSRFFRAIPELRDHSLRITAILKTEIKTIVEAPFIQPGSKVKYPTAFSQGLLENQDKIINRLTEYFGDNEVSLTDIQCVCQYLYGISKDELENLLNQPKDTIQNIIREWYKKEMKSFTGEDYTLAVDILSLLVLNDRTRNVFHEDAIVDELKKDYAPDKIKEIRNKLDEKTKLIRSESRKGGKYYEINSEALIPYINEQKVAKEQVVLAKKREDEFLQKKELEEIKLKNQQQILKIQVENSLKTKRSVKRISVLSGFIIFFLLLISFFSFVKTKNLNNKTKEIACFSKANQYLQEGDLSKAFGIYGYLDSIGSRYIKRQIQRVTLDYTDLPGKVIRALDNNFIFSQLNDSTFEVRKIFSNDSFSLRQAFTNVELRASNKKYFALYSNKQLLLFNTYTGGTDTINKQLETEPYFGFSAYADYFVYTVENDLYTINLTSPSSIRHFRIKALLKKAFKDILIVKDEELFCYYGGYLIAWKKNQESDSLTMAFNKSKDVLDSNWYPLHGDSILLINKTGLKLMDLDTKKTKIISSENFSGYDDISKPSDDLLFLSTSKNSYYDKIAFYSLEKKKLINVLNKGPYSKVAVDSDYSKCLISDRLGKVYLIDNIKEQLRYLKNSQNWKAYDISDDGNYIMYVVVSQTYTGTLYMYNITRDTSTKIDEVYLNPKKDTSDIYSKYYFRFNTTSDKIAYTKPGNNDSVDFVVKKIDNNKIVYQSASVTKILDDGLKTDFTKDYIHVYTNDNKEGLILLNGLPRTPVYYSRFYPKISQSEWKKLVKDLNLDL